MQRACSALATTTKSQLQYSCRHDCARRLSSAAVLSPSAHAPLKVGLLSFPDVGDATIRSVLRQTGAAMYERQAQPIGFLPKLKAVFDDLFNSERSEIGDCTELTSYRKLYLPFYLVDAIVQIYVTTPVGNARMYCHFDQFPIPAHNEADLQLLTIDAPPATKVKYGALDVERHLQAKGVEFFPFLFSPTTVASCRFGRGLLFKSVPLLDLSSSARQDQTDEARRSIDRGEQQSQSKDQMRLHPDILSVEYLSMSPVLLPIYLAKLTNSSKLISEDRRNMTLALPGWKMNDGSPHLINTHFGHARKALPGEGASRPEWISDGVKTRKNITLHFSPRIPILSRLQEEADRVNQATREADSKLEENVQEELRRKGIDRSFANAQKIRETYKEIDRKQRREASKRMAVVQEEESRRDAVEVTFVESTFQQRVQEAVERALRNDLAASQRLIEQHRHRPADEKVAPEKAAGLGAAVDWVSPRVTAPSGCDGTPHFYNHRAYFEAYAAWKDEERHINLWERTADEDDNLTYGVKTGAQLIGDAQKKMISLRPDWLQSWKDNLPRNIHKSAAEMRALGRQKSNDSSREEEEQMHSRDVIKPGKSARLLEQEAQKRKEKDQEKAEHKRRLQAEQRKREERKKNLSKLKDNVRLMERKVERAQERLIREYGNARKTTATNNLIKDMEKALTKAKDEIGQWQRG